MPNESLSPDLVMYANKVSDVTGHSTGLDSGNYEFYLKQMP
jgi:hypothetical protein